MNPSSSPIPSSSSYPYPLTDEPRLDVLRMIPKDGQVIGSFGCGCAGTEAVLVRQGRQVHGVDVNPEAIAVAARHLTSARTLAPDEVLPFEEESLDGLILADVLEHLSQAWVRLEQLARCVRKGGWIVISVPNMRNLDAIWQYVVRGDWPENPIGIFDATHLQFMTHKRLERWCANAKLDIEEWFHSPDPRHPRREPIVRLFNRLTFHRFQEYFEFQVQLRCRRRS
ncbi:MAG: hypothetical protein B6A08_03245 [Sorangiineae bacterium NIC37A_2]|nr:MAG: hypothetical protein B6A08_03245 [Sorangiineae bacterium NIC37A_2]